MRSHPRLPPRLDQIFPSNPVFFVTLCTYRRRPLLAIHAVNNALVDFAKLAYAERNIAVGRYVIMPDHIHLFVTGPNDSVLGRWIGLFKQFLGKAIERPETSDPLWQRGFFDHVLRSDGSYAQKWNYVRDNPVRAGLVPAANDWPYAGETIIIDRV